jgi:hypothetical protein
VKGEINMTYNWNTMEEITVPTGTNGWLYSGEVIINGVKVRFPVGVPTSVPEPAAVLLKKMIELEQEEDANTAKPQNHYVGSVTIPAGKTLTLEKGAKFVDNSGPSEVVILPETELTMLNDMEGSGGQYMLSTPFATKPTAGGTYKLMWGDVEYTSKAVEMPAPIEVMSPWIVLGNVEITGAVEGVENPDPSAPYAMIIYKEGISEGDLTAYATMVSVGIAPEPPVLSIVQTEGAASGGESAGGGYLYFTGTATMNSNTNNGEATLDKTFAQVLAAIKGKKPVFCALSGVRDNQIYILQAVSNWQDAMITLCGTMVGTSVELTMTRDGTNTVLLR